MFHKFRKSLQELKPGEIGFFIASIGAVSASIMATSQVRENIRQREENATREWQDMIVHAQKLVHEGCPYEGIARLKFYRAKLRHEVSQIGISDATPSELADEWLRRRNRGDIEAIEIDCIRLRLKRLWHSVENAVKHQEERNQKEGIALSSMRSGQQTLIEILGGGLGKEQVNGLLLQKTLMFLEPLDKCTCRNHPRCVWDRDCPTFYRYIRKVLDIQSDWPTETTNEDDFRPDAPRSDQEGYTPITQRIPQSRVALAMSKQEVSKKMEKTVTKTDAIPSDQALIALAMLKLMDSE